MQVVPWVPPQHKMRCACMRKARPAAMCVRADICAHAHSAQTDRRQTLAAVVHTWVCVQRPYGQVRHRLRAKLQEDDARFKQFPDLDLWQHPPLDIKASTGAEMVSYKAPWQKDAADVGQLHGPL